jgi:PAS domain S-box-containing protein
MARILFVDDEPTIRETLPKILALSGHTVVSAASVPEALLAITTQRFDLLISDLNIGHPADGFIVVSAMRRTNPDCVNFILTGYPGFDSALRAIREQVDEYLVKPMNIPQLLRSIDEKLRTHGIHELGARNEPQLRADKRISMILLENLPRIIELALAAMKEDEILGDLPSTDLQRTEGLVHALGELVKFLDEDGSAFGDVAPAPAARGGQLGKQQRYPFELIVQHKRILKKVISRVLNENLLWLDMSLLLPDLTRLTDLLFQQLATSIHTSLEAQGRPVPVEHLRERKVDAQPVSASVERLDAIIESAMDAIISLDAQQRVVLFNHASELLFGCSAADAMGEPLDRFLPEHLREVHRQHLDRFGKTGVTSRSMRSPATLNAVRSNGDLFPIEATISQVGAGDQKRYTVILRDITNRKQVERALVQSEKLASVGRLSAAVAHEINNPLEGMKNLLYMITTVPSDVEMVRKYAAMAETEVMRIAGIVQQVLGLSRGGDLHAPFRPTEVMDAVLALAHRKLQDKDAVCQKEYRQDAEAWGAASEVRQVFWNLLANGIDAIPERGLIRVRVASCHHPRDARKGVRITFADNGSGIVAQHMPHLFEQFYTTKSTGNGLGLWVSKQIIDNHSGSIRVRSRTDGARTGTVFSVFLPAER